MAAIGKWCESGGELNPMLLTCGFAASVAGSRAEWLIRDLRLCPRGDSPLTYMPAVSGELVLGGQQ
jgi:hypothetical protein